MNVFPKCTAVVLTALCFAGQSTANSPIAPSGSESTAMEAMDCKVLTPELANGRFTGACAFGLAHGQGVVHLPEQLQPVYVGGFEHGLRSGHGQMHYPNGDLYTGQWRQDERHGIGEYRFGPQSPWSGDRYNGHWQANRFDGHGRYTWGIGEHYEGPWKSGQQMGPATSGQARRQVYVAELLQHLPETGYRVCALNSVAGQTPQALVRSVLEDRLLIETHPDQPMTWQLAAHWRPCNLPSPQR